jgi:diketogulonate reductase-like aldo/keto reductase
MLDATLPLRDGNAIPRLGLGVYKSGAGRETQNAVTEALRAGYRHIDTASIYGNEADVGAALRESGIPRDQVFITTKLWNTDHKRPIQAFRESLDRLGLDYVVHWPEPGARLDAWKALIQLQREGLVRSIGVSNYEIRHLEEAIAATGVVPAVNQFELSPFMQRRALRAFCHQHGIIVEAYCPLTRGRKLDDPVHQELARETGRTPAQILIRWALQQDVVPLPKSVHLERIRENADVFDFELSDKQMNRLEALDQDFRVAWDPGLIP